MPTAFRPGRDARPHLAASCALFFGLALVILSTPTAAQFRDDFDAGPIEGWFSMTGDGNAAMSFEPHDGFARIQVDATADAHNVWWTIIKRDITASLDLEKLQNPAYELRVEARVRGSHAPRRVNFMLNTNRTTDFHEHLREYELPDTTNWHTISMTTQNFEVAPGDTVFVQLGVTDWGPGEYFVDVDYYRADVVRRADAAPDRGEPLVYHPPVPDISTFAHHLGVAHDSVIHRDFPDVNFNDWRETAETGSARVLTVTANQWPVLRWDFSSVKEPKAGGAGVLELTTFSIAKGGDYVAAFGEDLGIEFGKVRVIEILGGDPHWEQKTVTFESLLAGGEPTAIFNTQMIFDAELAEAPGASTYITLPRPVMQRLLDGTTKGLVLRPLGAIVASVYASEDPSGHGPKLHFNTE